LKNRTETAVEGGDYHLTYCNILSQKMFFTSGLDRELFFLTEKLQTTERKDRERRGPKVQRGYG
jgi:hypothetical protein